MTALNKQAQAIISDIRLKRGSGDVYAPIIRWDEFEVITGALEDAEKRIEEGICRANREHHRGFMMACNHLKEHANVHYADAAEMEIAALRQRINELEAADMINADYRKRLDRLERRCNHQGSVYWDASGVKRCAGCGIDAAGIGVKGE